VIIGAADIVVVAILAGAGVSVAQPAATGGSAQPDAVIVRTPR
jgi:hypothetical protein